MTTPTEPNHSTEEKNRTASRHRFAYKLGRFYQQMRRGEWGQAADTLRLRAWLGRYIGFLLGLAGVAIFWTDTWKLFLILAVGALILLSLGLSSARWTLRHLGFTLRVRRFRGGFVEGIVLAGAFLALYAMITYVSDLSDEAEARTYRAGQFLVEPSDLLGWFTGLGIAAIVLMLFTLFILRANYLCRLSPNVTLRTYGIGVGIGGGLSVVSTLVLTATSVMLFNTVLKLTNADVNDDRMLAAGIDQSNYSRPILSDTQMHGVAKELGTVSRKKNKGKGVAIVIIALLLVIGAGYSFTVLNLGFWSSFAAMSAGVGLPEELLKAACGVFVLYMLFHTKQLSEFQFRRTVLAAFAITGLGFGAGEALKYFGAYASEDAGAFWYGVRAVWCVTLHGAWTLIVGAIISKSLPQDPKTLKKQKAEVLYALLRASFPVAIAHGLYNACCIQSEILPWIVGGASLLVAFAVAEASLKANHGQPTPEQEAS